MQALDALAAESQGTEQSREYLAALNRLFRAVGEWVRGDYEPDAARGVARVRPDGFYATLGVRAHEDLEALVRYSFYDKDMGTLGDSIRTWTFGLTYTLKDFTNLKLNWMVRDAGEAYSAGAKPRNMLLAQVQVWFFPAPAVKKFQLPLGAGEG